MKKASFIILIMLVPSVVFLGIVGLMRMGLVSAADDPNRTYQLKATPVKSRDKESISYKLKATADVKILQMPNHEGVEALHRRLWPGG
ncbi:MAG: hypothetical protein V1701_01370 [Planctomycetota bacterium]